ncbi:hypothetical protein Bca4012_063988 [Brassica carinata]
MRVLLPQDSGGSAIKSRHANEEIRSCKNLHSKRRSPLTYSYRQTAGHETTGVHPNTSLSRIKKKKENNDAQKQLGQNKL